MRFQRRLFLLFVWALAFAVPVQAAVLLFDAFAAGGSSPTGVQYQTSPASTNGVDNNSLVRSTDNTGTNGQKPSTLGFSTASDGAWRTSSTMSSAVYDRADATGLNYPGLATAAGAANIFRSGSNSSTQLKVANRNLTSGLGSGESDLYFSALMQFNVAHLTDLFFFQGSESLGFGFDSTGKAIILNSGTVFGTASSASAAGQTHLLVAHVYSTNQVDLWLDPTDFASEGANASQKLFSGLTLTGFVAGAPLTSLRLNSDTGNSVSSPQSIFDEVRGATTWQEVFNVPEPSSALLLLLGGIVGSMVLRRRH